MKREKAVAVGNRAGIVEWANAAWGRVTGYALDDAIAKPVGDLLSEAGIDADVIGFVRRCFERGEPCEIELPLDPPGQPRRWIHVSVESLRDRYGEVGHFAAIAWDVTDEKRSAAGNEDSPARGERPAEPARPAPRTSPAVDLQLTSTDLSGFVREVVGRQAQRGSLRTTFDLDLPDRVPWVGVDRDRVERAVATLLGDASAAIGDEWGTVSVSTGVARSEALFVSPTYPRNCLLRGVPEGVYVFLEIHDTGPPIDRTVVAAVADATARPGPGDRAARLAEVQQLLQAHGGALRVDADPGFGTRVILLFPA